MIVNQLPTLMQQRNISIRQLSRRTCITYTTIRAVYHGERRSVQLAVLDAICQALDIQPGDIYRFQTTSRQSSEATVNKHLAVSEKTPSTSEEMRSPAVGDDGWRNW